MRAVDEDTGRVLAEEVEVADTFWKRFRGQMLRKRPGSLLFRGRNLHVHTCFMRFSLDLLYLRGERAVKLVRSLRPWRFCPAPKGSDALLELPARSLSKAGVREGHRISFRG
jgi:uncharacterized membrane protein (UPF0127 family)